ncbi:MAG: amidohydrolase family protein [Rhizobiaceae bacterium]|nr:amidohydrolase family protein [Rhizobiaceae bacterium]
MRRFSCVFGAALLFSGVAYAGDDHDHGPPIGKDVVNLPIFDAHIHYKKEAWGPFPPDEVMRLMDENNVAMGLVSSTPDEGTIKLFEHAPNRIVPELRPYHGAWGSSNWMDAPDMEAYLEQRLADHPHEGIGEFHVRQMETANRPLLEKVAAMAKARDIPIHIHSDDQPVRLLYEIEPSLTIIWAHAGMISPPQMVMEMFETYSTLYADTSYREGDILRSGGIDPEWLKVIRKFPDRLMVGTDTWVNGQWDRYGDLVKFNRVWLSYLPRKTAEMIAYKNAEKLFKRKVSLEQIGKR